MLKAKGGQKGQKRERTPSPDLPPAPVVQDSEQAASEDEDVK